MFKLITFVVLAVILYRMMFSPSIEEPQDYNKSEDEWVDYEEVE